MASEEGAEPLLVIWLGLYLGRIRWVRKRQDAAHCRRHARAHGLRRQCLGVVGPLRLSVNIRAKAQGHGTARVLPGSRATQKRGNLEAGADIILWRMTHAVRGMK
jgi:hypothetical protein